MSLTDELTARKLDITLLTDDERRMLPEEIAHLPTIHKLWVALIEERTANKTLRREVERLREIEKEAELAELRWEMENMIENHSETCAICNARHRWEQENFDYLWLEDGPEEPNTPEVGVCSTAVSLIADKMYLTERFKTALATVRALSNHQEGKI